jgi:hypothetical protein
MGQRCFAFLKEKKFVHPREQWTWYQEGVDKGKFLAFLSLCSSENLINPSLKFDAKFESGATMADDRRNNA